MPFLRRRGQARKPWVDAALCGALTTCACGRLGFDPAPLDQTTPGSGELEHDAGAARDDSDAGYDSEQFPVRASDGGSDAALPACASGVLICEGFERSLDGWSFARSDGTASISTDSHSGMSGIELATLSAGGHAFLEREIDPALERTLYLRAFLKVPATAEVAGYQFVVVSNPRGDAGLSASFVGAGLSLVDVASASSADGDVGYPRDRWFCIEMSVLSAPGGATLAVDGAPAATREDLGLPSGADVRIAIGIVSSSNTQAPTRVLIDDVVVATEPVGCE